MQLKEITPVVCRMREVKVPIFVLFALIFCGLLRAQDHVVPFSTTDPGITRAITNWGLDTCWPDANNMQRGLIYMGTNNVTIVRVGFFVDAPLTNNDVTPSDKAAMQTCANLAGMATAATRWDMNLASSVDPWYQSGANTVYPERWVAAMSACQRYYNKPLWAVEPFNEPDYLPGGEGSEINLFEIMRYLQISNNFAGTIMAGGSTLNNDVANDWYHYVDIASSNSIGTTHCLAGSASSYVGFIQNVTNRGDMPVNPELHNVVEAIIGANYGLQGGIWWGTAEKARGDFVKACQGKQLGYAEDRNNWTAAAVYRGSSGAVQAFVGEAERQSLPTTYRFFSRDRDVFYDGHGPQRAYDVTTTGDGTYWSAAHKNAERVINITWGSDVPPPINGQYIVVNRNSTKVMEVQNGSASNGANIRQNSYNANATYQRWNITPLPSTNGGDYSYYSITAVHSGKAVDVNNYSYADNANVQQWTYGNGANQQWIFEYVSNGWFNIRSRWSGKYLDVYGVSTANGANIEQWSGNGGLNQQWRLIPVGADPTDLTAPDTVTNVIAKANARSVQLNWDANSESDLAGYTILRSTNSGGPYEIVGRDLTNNAFTDNFANQAKAYYYVVKAVDKSLNSSGSSAVVHATPTGEPALIAHYAFDGNTDDASANANHPIVINGSPTFLAGQYGSALNLNGSGQYVMLPADMMAGVTDFTIAAWVYWNGGGVYQRIFDFGNDTTQYMYLSPSFNGKLRFAITTNSWQNEQALETSPLPVGQWTHVAITLGGTTARLYINGVLAATNSFTITPGSFNPVFNYLGKSQNDGDPQFNGRVDELVVYNHALSGTGMKWLMANQPAPTMPTTPTAIAVDFVANTLSLSWPTNYLGCRLQVQTNDLANGLGTNWFDVPDSTTTNKVFLPVDTTTGGVFYRLVYPSP